MPITEFRTRMLTGGRTAHFGYRPTKTWDRENQPAGLTRAELWQLPGSLRRAVLASAPEAYANGATILELAALPERFRVRVERRLRVLRKAAARKAARDM